MRRLLPLSLLLAACGQDPVSGSRNGSVEGLSVSPPLAKQSESVETKAPTPGTQTMPTQTNASTPSLPQAPDDTWPPLPPLPDEHDVLPETLEQSAYVSIKTPDGNPSICRGAMLSETVLMTNAHCFGTLDENKNWTSKPEAFLDMKAAELRDRIVATLANGQLRRGEKILHLQKVSYFGAGMLNIQSDFALVQMSAPKNSKIPVSILPTSLADLKVGENVILARSQRTGKQTNFAKSECTVAQTFPTFNNKAFAVLKDCFIHEGESGTPVFKKDGTLAAIVISVLNGTKGNFAFALTFKCLDLRTPRDPWVKNDPHCFQTSRLK